MTEVSHSLDSIKVEVYAEPNSKVCVYASNPSVAPISEKESLPFSFIKPENMDREFMGSNHQASNGKRSPNIY